MKKSKKQKCAFDLLHSMLLRQHQLVILRQSRQC